MKLFIISVVLTVSAITIYSQEISRPIRNGGQEGEKSGETGGGGSRFWAARGRRSSGCDDSNNLPAYRECFEKKFLGESNPSPNSDIWMLKLKENFQILPLFNPSDVISPEERRRVEGHYKPLSSTPYITNFPTWTDEIRRIDPKILQDVITFLQGQQHQEKRRTAAQEPKIDVNVPFWPARG